MGNGFVPDDHEVVTLILGHQMPVVPAAAIEVSAPVHRVEVVGQWKAPTFAFHSRIAKRPNALRC